MGSAHPMPWPQNPKLPAPWWGKEAQRSYLTLPSFFTGPLETSKMIWGQSLYKFHLLLSPDNSCFCSFTPQSLEVHETHCPRADSLTSLSIGTCSSPLLLQNWVSWALQRQVHPAMLLSQLLQSPSVCLLIAEKVMILSGISHIT